MNPAHAPQISQIAQEIESFKQGFGSIIIASVDEQGSAISSYAPLIQLEGRFYIYISEVAEHFHSIAANPSKIEVMLLEDESRARTLLARKRLKYRANAIFIARGSEEFRRALEVLESTQGASAKLIAQMSDFHLIRLELGLGRYVRGFGGAYEILPGGEIHAISGGHSASNPHKMNP